MFCTKCGAQNPDHAHFCTACGQPMAPGVDVPGQANATGGGSPKKKDYTKLILGIFFGTILVIMVLAELTANRDFVVRNKLSRVQTALDPVKTALALYYQEQGGFPLATATDLLGAGGHAPGSPIAPDTFWNSLGFDTYPTLPAEIRSLGVHNVADQKGGPSQNIALIVELQNIKEDTIDGAWIAVSPNLRGNAAGSYEFPKSNITSSIAAADSLSNTVALHWYYGCAKTRTQGAGYTGTDEGPEDLLRRYFKNGDQPMVCQ